MISSHDRSGFFGASDTKFVVGNYETKTFKNWWLEKLGIRSNNFTNLAMMAGTYYEHKILDAAVPHARKDHQILIPELKLRVNLDGDTEDRVYEVKTYKYKSGFKLYPYYISQVQAEMFAKKVKKAYIVSYGLLPQDYKNFFNVIDSERIDFHPFEYDEEFIENTYLPRLRYLCGCLEETKMPVNFEKR